MRIKNDIVSCKTCVYRTLLFGSLNDIEYNLVNNARKEIEYKRGERVKSEGDTVDSFLYLRKGLVKLFKTQPNGKEHILSVNKPGDFISLLHIFANKSYTYSIEAIEDTLVCEVDLSVINHLIKTNGDFAHTVIRRMSLIADEIIDNRFLQSQRQIKGRVASILLFFSEQIYHKTSFTLPLTRREIGELISMTTENTIRTLSNFNNDGIIRLDGKQVELLNVEMLKRISQNG